ncbi:hypothetical protein F4553_000015 [Allocatelliglobosispora scoriae]|uniref:Uncharacterized protein n=1 Tax=Allocatelliglobosispora scoriae TaxID=643052 RepID=A0A841BHJ2_9ACTN|nr:hypothetical protein [Allocatelliglobosispora scoriae]MBB5866636.1 hypothetical protein [Allocatelliglobosispora scoriae]
MLVAVAGLGCGLDGVELVAVLLLRAQNRHGGAVVLRLGFGRTAGRVGEVGRVGVDSGAGRRPFRG